MSAEQSGKEHFGDWADRMGIKIIQTPPSKTAPVKPLEAQHAELAPEPKWWQVEYRIRAVDRAEQKELEEMDLQRRCEDFTCRHLMFLHVEEQDGTCRVCFERCSEGDEEE